MMVLLRKCISCGKRDNKFNFIRINKIKKINNSFEIKVSEKGRKCHIDGRTAYICPDEECFLLAKKKSRVEKSLKCRINREIYDKIESLINSKN